MEGEAQLAGGGGGARAQAGAGASRPPRWRVDPRWMVAVRYPCAAWPASPNSCFSEVGCHSFLRPRTILPCGVSC